MVGWYGLKWDSNHPLLILIVNPYLFLNCTQRNNGLTHGVLNFEEILFEKFTIRLQNQQYKLRDKIDQNIEHKNRKCKFLLLHR